MRRSAVQAPTNSVKKLVTTTYDRLGVSELIFDFRSESQSESLERMEHFTTVIKPTVVA